MIVYVVALRLAQTAIMPDNLFHLVRLQEVAELILVVGVVVFLAHVLWLDRRLRGPAPRG